MIPAAVGVLRRPDGRVLLQRRPAGKVFAGHWEFPGGKVNPGELPPAAMARELREEIGVECADARLWLRRAHKYPHGRIDLHFFRVCQWRGAPAPREGQELRWVNPRDDGPFPLLPANAPIWRRLALPDLAGVSAAEIIGADAFLRGCARALEAGFGLIQLRDKRLDESSRLAVGKKTAELARNAGALLVVNDDENLARALGADGLHWSAPQLARAARRPDFDLAGASCHGRAEILRAQELGLDYAMVSPVKRTLSHAQAPPLGWEAFSRLAREFDIPLYGLGGLTSRDLPDAFAAGAQGAAMMRAAWE